MASTITIKSDAYKGRYMQLVCEQVKDEINNKSVIKWTLSSIGGEVNYYSTGPTSVYINGTCVYYKDRVNYTAEVFPAAKGSVSGTIEVTHNEDGTKGISVLMNTVIYQGSSKVKAYSSWWELDHIPRGAKFVNVPPTFSNVNPPSIEYTNSLGNNAAKVEACIEDSKGIDILAPYRDLEKTGTYYTFTDSDMIPLNERVAPSGKELNVTFVIRTVTADGKEYFDVAPRTYYMAETEDTKPTVTMSLAVSNPSSVPSSLANTYIQGKSGVNATITAEGRYKATISNVAVKADIVGAGRFFTPPTAKDTITLTTGAITKSGSVEVVGSATDLRGFTGEAKQTINVTAYSKPLIEPIAGESSIKCYRSDNYGERKGNSTRVWIKVKRTYHSLKGHNLCKLQWRHRQSTEAWNNTTHQWLNLIARTDTETDEYDGLVSGEFALNKSYVIQIRAVDDFTEYSYDDFEIPTQDVALHLGAEGQVVTIGDYCDRSDPYTFRSAWKAKFDNGIYGTLTPQLATNVLTYATGCQIGTTPIYASADSGQLPPNGNFKGASGFVLKTTDTQITVVLFSNDTGSLAINIRNDTIGGWLGWKYIHTTLS